MKPILSKSQRATIVINQYDGILPQEEVFYILSVQNSARSALLAFQRYEDSLPADGNEAIIVGAVHEGLIHAAALSRFFWPTVGGKKNPSTIDTLREARGKKLRAAFGVQDTSPLKSRKLRNGIEHFDEGLDEHLLNENAGTFIPWPTVGSNSIADNPEERFFKLVDPEKSSFILLGQEYFFGELLNEVRRVFSISVRMEAGGGRLGECF